MLDPAGALYRGAFDNLADATLDHLGAVSIWVAKLYTGKKRGKAALLFYTRGEPNMIARFDVRVLHVGGLLERAERSHGIERLDDGDFVARCVCPSDGMGVVAIWRFSKAGALAIDQEFAKSARSIVQLYKAKVRQTGSRSENN